jgi:hypothetical protein
MVRDAPRFASPRRPDPDPIAYWRNFSEPEFDAARCDRVLDALRQRAPLYDERWRAAVAGEAAASIGIALELLAAEERGDELDMAMTAVLSCALCGDPAAALVVSHGVRRIGEHPQSARIATSWLAANLAKAEAEAARRGQRR